VIRRSLSGQGHGQCARRVADAVIRTLTGSVQVGIHNALQVGCGYPGQQRCSMAWCPSPIRSDQSCCRLIESPSVTLIVKPVGAAWVVVELVPELILVIVVGSGASGPA